MRHFLFELDAITFVSPSVFTLVETAYVKICAKPAPINAKQPLPVVVSRSKTPLLKPPNVTVYWRIPLIVLRSFLVAKFVSIFVIQKNHHLVYDF